MPLFVSEKWITELSDNLFSQAIPYNNMETEYNYTFQPEDEFYSVKLLSVKDFHFATLTFRRDGTVDFTSTLTIKEVRACMKQVAGGYRMTQTLNYADKYDGEHWYEDEDN